MFLDKSLSLNIRFLAVIQLKNGIDKFWRLHSHVKNGIKKEEKDVIRARLLQGSIEEEENNLALHNALVVAKVVRIDYPTDWPDAFSSLIQLLRTLIHGNQQHLTGTLQVLLRVVKELGTAKIRRFQTSLQSVAPELVYVLGEIYSDKSTRWMEFLANNAGDKDEAPMAMQNSLLALKILRRLIILGYEKPHSDKTVEQFWTMSQNQFGQLLGFVSHDSGIPVPYQDVVGKHLLQFTKLHIDMSEHHASSFVFLPQSLALVQAYWELVAKFAEMFDKSGGIRQGTTEPGTAKSKVEGPLLERLALKGLLILRACVKIAFQPIVTLKYRTAETKAEQEQARNIIRNELLKEDLVVQIVNAIISHLFVFRKSDLDAWEEDPEEWEQQEQSEGSAYEWEVRPCAEKLFLDLLTNYKDLLVPPLLAYFQTAENPQADIATKEAVYTAMGLAAAHVFKVFDFNAVLSTTIAKDAQQTGGLHKILRRRIAILVSQWATIELTDASRPIVYEMFRHFLGSSDDSNDLVVRITAARQLRWIVDELGFDVEAFLPFTADVLSQLSELIHNIDADETKLAILESMRILVTRMETKVSQFGDQLMTVLPAVWEGSGTEEYMIKQAVIAIFAALVMSMGGDSQRYQHFMLPLLSEAAKPGSGLHLYLIDESLELWNAILMQSSPPLAPEITALAHLALPLLAYSSETAYQALGAVESYILLAPEAMLEDALRGSTFAAVSCALDSRNREQVRVATLCVEYLIRFAVERGGPNGVSLIMQDVVNTGLLGKVMAGLRESWEADQSTGPNKKVSTLNLVKEGDYFAILARLALAEPSLFMQMLTSFGSLEEVWGWVSTRWFTYQGESDNVDRRKLYLLALTRLLELPSPVQELVLAKLQDYFVMWTSVIMELQDGVANGTDTLIWNEVETSEYDTPKIVAEREMEMRDPIHSVHAFAFVKMRLEDLVNRLGGEAAFQEQWAVNVDGDVMEKFQSMLRAVQ